MEREHYEYESVVRDALVAAGYPKESIILEGQIDIHCYVDIIVNDVDTGLPLMIIEIKSCGERTQSSVRQLAFKSLQRYYNKIVTPVKAVAAILDRQKVQLEFIDFTEAIKENDFERAINNYKLPLYEILKIGARQKVINNEQEKQNKRFNILKILCWAVFPTVCLALILLDAFGVYTLSTLRLITVGAGAIAALIPCFKEIKIGEISLKHQIEKQKEENEE